MLGLAACQPQHLPARPASLTGAVLYIANDDGSLYAYQIGTWTLLAQYTNLPITDGVRGIDSAGHDLYIAHGSDRSGGFLLNWNLLTQSTVWNKHYSFGIDQFSICEGTVYMPTGELSSGDRWELINASTGAVTGSIAGGAGPHNTICLGSHQYLGGRRADYLIVRGIGAGAVGPTPSAQAGVRPFTVNAAETRVYMTWTDWRGFSVGDVATGRLVGTISFGPVPTSFNASAPSHGISLSPDGTQIYVLDTPTRSVRVYSSADSPTLLATIGVAGLTGSESPCAYDCARDGWLLHSLDGRYVFVGDSGDVISTSLRSVVAHLSPLANDRHGFIEVDFSGGVPVGNSTHFGIGR